MPFNAWIEDPKFIATEQPVLSNPSSISLTYGSTILTLRNPDFGNSHRLEMARINRKTRGGDLRIKRDPMWPESEILTFKFSYLKESDTLKLLHFYEQSLGKDVVLVDYEGRSWTGIITNKPTIGEGSKNNFTTDIVFQGILT